MLLKHYALEIVDLQSYMYLRLHYPLLIFNLNLYISITLYNVNQYFLKNKTQHRWLR